MSATFRPGPLSTIQHREFALDLTAGVGGYRLAFTAPGRWQAVDDPRDSSDRDLEFPSMDAAWAARTTALALWSDFISQLNSSRGHVNDSRQEG